MKDFLFTASAVFVGFGAAVLFYVNVIKKNRRA